MKGLFNTVENLPAFSWVNQRKLGVLVCIGLWICAVLLYGFGDLVTTNLLLTNGGRELNPVFGTLGYVFGGDIWGPAIAKAVILSCLIAIYLFGSVKHRWAIPGLLSLAGIGLMVSNSLQYLAMQS